MPALRDGDEMTDQPHLDYDHIDSLLEFLPVEKVGALFDSGLRGAPPLIDAMRAALASGDANEVYRAGHTAKGMFGNLGMRRCEDVSRRVEAQGKAGDLAGVGAMIEALQLATDETSALMTAWLEAKSKPA